MNQEQNKAIGFLKGIAYVFNAGTGKVFCLETGKLSKDFGTLKIKLNSEQFEEICYHWLSLKDSALSELKASYKARAKEGFLIDICENCYKSEAVFHYDFQKEEALSLFVVEAEGLGIKPAYFKNAPFENSLVIERNMECKECLGIEANDSFL